MPYKIYIQAFTKKKNRDHKGVPLDFPPLKSLHTAKPGSTEPPQSCRAAPAGHPRSAAATTFFFLGDTG